jgi:nucleoside-diphosphate-sugar epimerase
MPTIAPGDKILVSGANGYIAVWVVRTFLEQGYAVRGTVRSADKGRYLSDLFNKDYSGKFELVIVEDITKVRSVGCQAAPHVDRSSSTLGGCLR